jgi:hypothetical protein
MTDNFFTFCDNFGFIASLDDFQIAYKMQSIMSDLERFSSIFVMFLNVLCIRVLVGQCKSISKHDDLITEL